MSRLMRLNIEDESAIVQKTVRIPSELYKDIEKLMQEANIDSFNKACVELFRLEVQDWKNESLKVQKETKEEQKKETKKNQKKTTKKELKTETKNESFNEINKETK